jgi:hypothetical protein
MNSAFSRTPDDQAAARFTRSRDRNQVHRKPNLAQLLSSPASWAMSIMTHKLTEVEKRRFKQDLADFAGERGLQVYAPHALTVFAPTDGPITSDDRGAVLAWLVERVEVHLVLIRKRPSPAQGAGGTGSVGSASSFMVSTGNRRREVDAGRTSHADMPTVNVEAFEVPDEDRSQEPDAYPEDFPDDEPRDLGHPSRMPSDGRSLELKHQEKRHGR